MASVENSLIKNSAGPTWSDVPVGPLDPILAVAEAFKASTSPLKMNLGVGAYRDEDGKPFVLPSVRQAEAAIVAAKYDKEYIGTTGLPEFTKRAALLAYGSDSAPLKEERIAITQSLSGTGALRIGCTFLQRFYPHSTAVYVPTPTWGNHIPMFKEASFEIKRYRYFDKKTVGLDATGMLEDLKQAPNRSIILLHACAHNPTGVDPTHEQWKEIAQVIKGKGHFSFFDMAYQGFASGDVEGDAFAPRYFVSQGLEIVLSQSFSKIMGLYGERVGAFSVICSSQQEKSKVESQFELLIRLMYLNPPVHGARIASMILSDPALYKQWLGEVKLMADRIIGMRTALFDTLVDELGSRRNWDHIKSQAGMFCFIGISSEQVEQMATKHDVYMTRDGRMSMAGITHHNVKHLAKALHDVTK
ncbi:aspartate transaminase aat1 [Puccinia graminis f. sp. tritici]|uniref:Aspartate aminotransferase n=1 Tax=Puccinia graminis f. sp. tritici TaxID=56615 RepID=A0A5B0SQR5_PUCGR|nr:aspartate transaminase aat1 [Puccinia graminis f. sp. tritici]